METPQVRFARLSKDQIAVLHQLEEELGTYVLAFEPIIKVADLSPEQLAKLQKIEQDLGVILVAYQDA